MNQEELHRLIEDNHQLAELQQHPGWEVAMRWLQKWLNEHEALLMGGGITDINQYKLVAGRVQGIRHFLDLPNVISRAIEQAKLGDQEWVDEFIPSEEYSRDTQETTVGG